MRQRNLTDEEVLEVLEYLIGFNYDENVRREAMGLSRRKAVRAIGPRYSGTMDYNPQRVNINLDDNNVIVAITFG